MTDEQMLENTENTEQNEKLELEVVSIEDSGVLKKKIKIEIPESQIKEKLDENYKELMREAQIPGFRVGHAPRKLIEKRFGKDVREQVKQMLIGQAINQVIEDKDIKTLGDPDIKLDEIELPETGSLQFEFEVEVEPEFELPKLEGIELTEEDVTITEEDINKEIEKLQWNYANLEEMPEGTAAEQGDHLLVDYVLEIDDLAPVIEKDASIAVRDIPIAGITFDNLEKELTGVKVGDTKELTATVSDEHSNEDWRGKKAKIKITVKKISRWIKPEFNDELVKRIGFESVDEYKEAVKTQLEANKGQQIRADLEEQVKKYLLENTNIDLPEGVTDRYTDYVLRRRVIEFQRMGIPPALIEQKLDDIKKRAKEEAIDELKLTFIIGKIAKQYEIQADDAEINGVIASIASRSGRRPERVRTEMMRDGSYSSVVESIVERKVIEKLIDQAKIEKKEAKKEKKDTKKAKKTSKKDDKNEKES